MQISSSGDEVSFQTGFQPIEDMFQCSFASLPQEMLFKPFYWEKSYAGLADYVNCAKSRNVHRQTVVQCYQFLEKQCQSPTQSSV